MAEVEALGPVSASTEIVKLFGNYGFEDVQVTDLALSDYIAASVVKHATFVPHTSVKKLMAVRIVKHAMAIIHLLTDLNPIQVIVDAFINSGPREDATRIGSVGVVRRQTVDISPLRRVNQEIYLLTTGARESAFRNIKTIADYAIKKKDEIERVAKANR
uniref:Small ribosomal subunit protein uS7 domain-containing protein n=1 Tax=Chenopodium quinoa TaxID=63459 RepID=A0A803LLW8_CHEQI